MYEVPILYEDLTEVCFCFVILILHLMIIQLRFMKYHLKVSESMRVIMLALTGEILMQIQYSLFAV